MNSTMKIYPTEKCLVVLDTGAQVHVMTLHHEGNLISLYLEQTPIDYLTVIIFVGPCEYDSTI